MIDGDFVDLPLAEAAAFEDERGRIAQPGERHLVVVHGHHNSSRSAAPLLLVASDEQTVL